MEKKPVLSPEFCRDLAENNPLGMRLEESDVRSWFDLIWIKYKLRSYTQHRRAITNWWSNLREEDIVRARERTRRIREEAEIEALERASDEINESRFGNVRDIFSEVERR